MQKFTPSVGETGKVLIGAPEPKVIVDLKLYIALRRLGDAVKQAEEKRQRQGGAHE